MIRIYIKKSCGSKMLSWFGPAAAAAAIVLL